MAAYINAIAYYLPEKIVSNEYLSSVHPEWSVEKISSKIGVNKRHWSCNETAGDLAYSAANKLFADFDINKDDIDFIILCTQSPDYFLPSTSCILQERLGLSTACGAFDFNLGCSGYIYGLGVAKGLIETNQARNVLLLTGETYSKFLNEQDKGNKTIFGDAGSATLVSINKGANLYGYKIEQFCYGTDGSGAESLIVRNGCARYPNRDGVNMYGEDGSYLFNNDNLYMDGKAIFNFTAFKVPELIEKTLKINEEIVDSVDLFIFHQANEFMLNTVKKRCNIPSKKFFVDIKDVGNTVSNTIPIAICKAQAKGLLNSVSKILLSGFGVGLSMGAVLIKKDL